MSARPDEFTWIDRLRPLTRGDRRALDLRDDAAVLPSRTGFDLVISKDTLVEGVHLLAGEAADIVARRLLRTSLSDLAAKAAEPFGYFLSVAWPDDRGWPDREAFIEGLDVDGKAFSVVLLGGDTVATSGPLTVSATVLGWAPAGHTVLRSGARAGDVLMVCGVIGDGWLGLQAARGAPADGGGRLARYYRLPEPLFALREALRAHATAAADVSDGLLADACHIGEASGLAVQIDLERMPLSPDGAIWLARQPDRTAGRIQLAAGGDDYAIVCAVDPADATAFGADAARVGVSATPIGGFGEGAGMALTDGAASVQAASLGWRH